MLAFIRAALHMATSAIALVRMTRVCAELLKLGLWWVVPRIFWFRCDLGPTLHIYSKMLQMFIPTTLFKNKYKSRSSMKIIGIVWNISAPFCNDILMYSFRLMKDSMSKHKENFPSLFYQSGSELNCNMYIRLCLFIFSYLFIVLIISI